MPEHGAELAEDLQRFINLYGADTIAAVFVEPIAGSTGVLVPPKGYLERLRKLCDQHGILLVFDEVICGFGRTGKAFGAQSFNVTPDVITMAKAITNGAQPMGAVAAKQSIYDTIVGAAPEATVEFFHVANRLAFLFEGERRSIPGLADDHAVLYQARLRVVGAVPELLDPGLVIDRKLDDHVVELAESIGILEGVEHAVGGKLAGVVHP